MLDELRCESCTSSAVALDAEQTRLLLTELEGWHMLERDGIPQLEKVYTFKNYKLAWAFANKVSELAEGEFHHPSLLLEWGKVTVTWWSHAIKGLHQNDFICAAKCDQVLL
ncbi:4a-hydroxytetrahydrobiopterin dehydratase [Vibrio caribbeanicus]|uniref:Putative pterin-4-alpha-carbinolamine dehydratase n=1 Tax=Vibrio caribbeanicus ATCC BAA-2122 TaxID=796620 RepID=E3BML9_9VIBR|nr:4a-hydroxytetrahydrobiopterin dehydratase [Vibrio caribbeanicus]EFP95764.1 pterin-4-alpha-carbinolamine dehydratase [Vibrio caribbeanicus ATCC BAA-2122]